MRTKFLKYTMAVLMATGTMYAAPEKKVEAQPEVSTEMLMKMERDSRCGQILVTGLVGGTPLRLMLDTGATHTVLHTESAAKLKNVRWVDTSMMRFLSNSAQVPKMLMTSLLVGPGESPVHPMVVMDLSAVRNMLAEKVDGIVGMDFLASLPFTYDFGKNEFYWGMPAGLSVVPLRTEPIGGGRMNVLLNCGGKELKLVLDTGSTITRVPAESWAPGAAGEITAQIGNVDAAAEQKLIEGKPGDIEVGPGVVLRGVAPLLGGKDEPAVLGLDALKDMVLIHMPSEQVEGGIFLMGKNK